jgi:general secretion pathway protein D
MVLDNQTANIKVGNQIPVTTSITQSSDVGTTQAVQYKDTGVLLEVTPRVNVGGLVTLELSQEVTTVGNATPPSNNLSFFQRSIQTNVAVQTGQTIVLGGLIRDTKINGKRGVPILYDMPVIGGLFGSTTTSTDRTELIVLITPRVVRDQAEARQVTEELKQKLRGLAEPLEALKPARRSPDSLNR